MKRALPGSGGFTLVELMVTIAIVAALAGLIMPAVGKSVKRANSIACMNNLRQIGVCGLLYAADNNQKFPVIEPWSSNPIYEPEDGAKTISEVFEPYGLTERSLACRDDVAGPDNYFAKEGSSYQWFPGASGQNLQNVKLSWGNMPEGVKLSQLLVAFDYTNIHGGKSNILFGDGHVAAAIGNQP